MKKIVCLTLFFLALRLHALDFYPPHWYPAFNTRTLQLIVHGDAISSSTNWESLSSEVRLDSIHTPQNQHYRILYLVIDPSFSTDSFALVYQIGKKKHTCYYRLRNEARWEPTSPNEHDLIYQIMPHRFANGNPNNDLPGTPNPRDPAVRRYGGDIQGVIDRLDYLQGLGANVVWLNSVYESKQTPESAYDDAITNHYRLDPNLGVAEDYLRLKLELESRGMKLIKDMAFNQVGDRHLFYSDLIDSSFFYWWPQFTQSHFRASVLMDPYASETEKRRFEHGWQDRHLPRLNTNNPHLQAFLIQQTLWWVQQFRLNGLHIGEYVYSGMDFMKLWQETVMKEFPGLFVFGDIREDRTAIHNWFGQRQENDGSVFLSLSDFPLSQALRRSFMEDYGWNTGLAQVYHTLSEDNPYGNAGKRVTFIDNQHLPRSFGVFGKDTLKLQSALSMLLTLRGIPCLYYGTEQLMTSEGDDVRPPNAKAYYDTGTYRIIRALSRLRAEHPAFDTDARFIQFIPKNHTYVYMRKKDGRGILVLCNANRENNEVQLRDFSEFYEATARTADMKLSLQGVELNRNAVFYLDPYEVVVIEW